MDYEIAPEGDQDQAHKHSQPGEHKADVVADAIRVRCIVVAISLIDISAPDLAPVEPLGGAQALAVTIEALTPNSQSAAALLLPIHSTS